MRQTKGVTMVEMLIALAVAGIALGALASSQVLGFRVTRDSLEASIARDAATEQIELIRSYGYGTYKDCPDEGPDYTGPPACEGRAALSDHDRFVLSWTITDEVEGVENYEPDPALLAVDVTVSWDNGEASYTLASYLSCADAGDFSFTEVPCPAEPIYRAPGTESTSQ